MCSNDEKNKEKKAFGENSPSTLRRIVSNLSDTTVSRPSQTTFRRIRVYPESCTSRPMVTEKRSIARKIIRYSYESNRAAKSIPKYESGAEGVINNSEIR